MKAYRGSGGIAPDGADALLPGKDPFLPIG
jgi:hypothetical protein